jgi:hypothetical protein
MNPNDDRRDRILRFLYNRHQNARGITAIPIGIQELRREMKRTARTEFLFRPSKPSNRGSLSMREVVL